MVDLGVASRQGGGIQIGPSRTSSQQAMQKVYHHPAPGSLMEPIHVLRPATVGISIVGYPEFVLHPAPVNMNSRREFSTKISSASPME
jgi:hypothetical protein